jgi:hypothetical protein
MKRVLLSACLLFGSFGLTGCESGGVQEGMPPDPKKTDKPLDSIKTDAADGPKMPAGGAPAKDAPKPGAAAPDAPKN